MTAAKPKPWLKWKPAYWAVLAGVLAVMACGDRNVYAPPPAPQVTVSRPVRQPVVDYLDFTGNTQAFNTVQLRARVQGYLEKVFFQDGDLVKKGQLLFLIQPNTYEAKLQQAEAEILRQKASLDHAQIEFDRFSRLVKQKAAAQTDVDNWRFQRDSAQAAIKVSEAQRDLAKLDLSYTKVTAPFDGRIDRRLRDPGNLVGAGESTLLAEINQINPIYVYYTINETELLRLIDMTKKSAEEAQKVQAPLSFGVANEEGYPHQGYLDFAAISLTPTTGTLQMRGVFPNRDGKLLPGMFARVRRNVAGSEKISLTIPEVAIGYDQLGAYVLVVVGEKNLVEHRPVKLGLKIDQRRVVQEGLTGDEQIITSGQLRAFPGKAVTPVQETPPAPPAAGAPASPGQPKKGAP